MKTRIKALIVVLAVWIVGQIGSRLLNQWMETNLNPGSLSSTMMMFRACLAAISGQFAFGLLVGAAIFSIWDWPVVGLWLKRQRQHLRDKAADETLAKECDEISEFLYAQAALIERRRSEMHWQAAEQENHQKAWLDARKMEAREAERIQLHIGNRVRKVLVQLKARGLRMDLWHFSLGNHGLHAASFFLSEVADALRTGTYFEREFKAGHSHVPVMM